MKATTFLQETDRMHLESRRQFKKEEGVEVESSVFPQVYRTSMLGFECGFQIRSLRSPLQSVTFHDENGRREWISKEPVPKAFFGSFNPSNKMGPSSSVPQTTLKRGWMQEALLSMTKHVLIRKHRKTFASEMSITRMNMVKMLSMARFGNRPLVRLCSRVSSSPEESNAPPQSTSVSPPNVSLDLMQLNFREQRIASILRKHCFFDSQISLIIRHFRENNVIYEIDPNVITDSIKFWGKHVLPPSKRSLVTTTPGEEFSLTDIVSYECPRLLLINPEHMKKRVEALKKIGFLSGKNDLWSVFAFAPRAFYLQDWRDFCLKYLYVQHRVLDFLIDKKKDPFPTPHPLVKAAKVMELPYPSIKARFEFLIKTGIKTPQAAMRSGGKPLTLDLHELFLTHIDRFLITFAPHITEEEFNVFEKMIEENPDDEDKVLTEICELNSMTFSADHGFIDSLLDENHKALFSKEERMRRKTEENRQKKGWLRGSPKVEVEEEDDDGNDNELTPLERKTVSHLTRLTD